MIPKEQRVAIGKEIVDGLISPIEASKKYGISRSAAQKYATDYRRANGLPVRSHPSQKTESPMIKLKNNATSFDLEDYHSMSKEQLIEELIKAKINETTFSNFALRSYISTFLAQFVDNFIFAIIVSKHFFGWTMEQILLCSLFGATCELLCEVCFSKLGYRILQSWEKENVGKDYIAYRKNYEESKNAKV